MYYIIIVLYDRTHNINIVFVNSTMNSHDSLVLELPYFQADIKYAI